MRTLLTALASIFLLLAGSCTSPLATLKVGLPSLPPVGPGETQLVFHLNSSAKANYSYGVAQITYLVVQLHSKYGQGSRFATVSVASPTVVAVNVPGLVAGPWELLVSAYDWDGVTGTSSPWNGSSEPTLLYTGMDQVTIQPATKKDVTLYLYKPGDLGDVTLTPGVPAASVVLSPVAPMVTLPTSVAVSAGPFQLGATVYAADGITEASNKGVSWFSDNPAVADVGATGAVATVFPKSPGTAKITARSQEGEKWGTNISAQFVLTVNPLVAGVWKLTPPPAMGDTYLKVWADGSNNLHSRLYSQVNYIGTPSEYQGSVTGGSSPWSFTFDQSLMGTTFQAYGPYPSSGSIDGSGNLVLGGAAPVMGTYAPFPSYVPVKSADLEVSLGVLYPVTGSGGTLTVLPKPGKPVPSIRDWNWVSSNSGVATIMGSNSFNVVSAGVATLTGTSYDDLTQQITVTLGPPYPNGSYPGSSGVGRFNTVVPDASGSGWFVAGYGAAIGVNANVGLLAHLTVGGGKDSAFGASGLAVTFPGQYFGHGQWATGLTQDPSTKKVTINGYFQNGIGNNGFARYLPNGSLDTTFGSAGFDLQDSNFVPQTATVRDDLGNTYTVGWLNGPIWVKKRNAAGVPDTAFEANTQAIGLNSSQYHFYQVAVYPSTDTNGNAGKILLVGGRTTPTVDGVIFRLNPNGTTDTTWGNTINKVVGMGSAGVLTALRIDATGRIVAVGNDGATSGWIHRFTVAGAPDASFNGMGSLSFPSQYPTDLAIQSDGKIVVVGDTTLNETGNPFVLRLLSSGTNDSGAHLGNDAFGPFGGGARAVAIDGAGNVGVAGFTKNDGVANSYNTVPQFWMVRFGP